MRSLVLALMALALLATSCASHRAQWTADMRRGSANLEVGDYRAARPAFDSALRTADAMRPYYTLRWAFQANALSALARLAALEERWSDAETHLTRWLAIAADEAGEIDPTWAYRSLRRALVHLHRVEEATRFHEMVLTREGTLPAAVEAAFGLELEHAGHNDAAVAAFERSEEQAGLDLHSSGMAVVARLRLYADALDAVGREADAASARAKSDAIRDESDYVRHVLFGNEFQEIAAYWPVERMPLSVRIERPSEEQTQSPDATIALAREAVMEWADAVSSGIPSFEFREGDEEEEEEEERSEIIIRWSHNEGQGRRAGFCKWDARWQDDPLQGSDVVIHSRVFGRYRREAQMRHILVHEVGHALGLLGHSTLEEDIMYREFSDAALRQQPTARDLRTLRHLYREPLGGYGPRMSEHQAETPSE